MKLITAFCAMFLLTACGGASISSGGNVARGAPADYGIAELPVNPIEDASFGSILNSLRLDNGGTEVTYDARLEQAAQAHAEDMIARDFFSHTNPDGETEKDRIIAAGYNPRSYGENLAGRTQTEADTLVVWIESPEHNRLLNADTVDEFGLGMAGDGNDRRWVLVMASERD